MTHHGLSKSRIAVWSDFSKYVWLQIYHPELLETSASIQHSVKICYEVEVVAQEIFKNEILMKDDKSLSNAISFSKLAIKLRPDLSIFKDIFQHDLLVHLPYWHNKLISKWAFLKAFGADTFFDNQNTHCDSTREHIATVHVANGNANG